MTRDEARSRVTRSSASRLVGAVHTAAGRLDEYRTFLHSALQHPREVGAALPTTSAVAAVVGQVVPTTGAPVVVELGPGTGSLSDGIHARLPRAARHVGIEVGAEMVEHLRTHKPWLEVVHGDAGDLTAILDKLRVDAPDAIISSIPWSLLSADSQAHILGQVTEVLPAHGVFTALTYVPAERSAGGKHFRALLDTSFDEVLTHTTWRCFPPILHYICRRPFG